MKNKKIRQGLSGLLCAALLSQPLAASAGWYWSDGTENLTEEQLGEMLTFANAAAAIVTTRKGAIRAMPEKEEVEALIRS